MNETCVERIAGESYCTVFTAERKHINKLLKLKESYPNEVQILAENDDGSIIAHVPFNWFKFVKPPAKREFTEEQKQAMAERMRKAREGK